MLFSNLEMSRNHVSLKINVLWYCSEDTLAGIFLKIVWYTYSACTHQSIIAWLGSWSNCWNVFKNKRLVEFKKEFLEELLVHCQKKFLEEALGEFRKCFPWVDPSNWNIPWGFVVRVSNGIPVNSRSNCWKDSKKNIWKKNRKVPGKIPKRNLW